MEAFANPGSKISVALDGLEGSGSAYSRVMAGVQRAAGGGRRAAVVRSIGSCRSSTKVAGCRGSVSWRVVLVSPIPLADGSAVGFFRRFHVEVLRGGMNRLLLRAKPSAENPVRVEVLFQYVQHLDIPMSFEGLTIEDATAEDGLHAPWSDVLVGFPKCRVFRLLSGGRLVGRVIAAACSYGEDDAVAGAPSMFPMMG